MRQSPSSNPAVHDILSKVVVYPDRIWIEFNMSGIEELLVDAGLEKAKAGEHAPYSYEVPCDLCKYGNVTKLVAPTAGEIQRNEVLVKAISTAYQYAEKLEHGKYQGSVIDLAFDLGKDKSDVRRTLKLVNLAPDIVQSIFNGDGPKRLSLADLMRAMPADWCEQRRMYGFPEPVGVSRRFPAVPPCSGAYARTSGGFPNHVRFPFLRAPTWSGLGMRSWRLLGFPVIIS